MAVFRRALLLLLFVAPRIATADGECTTLDVDFLPAATSANPFGLQVVAWLEDTSGKYIDTIFITQQTGTFGIGNRPGRFDFNSGPNWPYGRRITVFPVWAHRHGLMWDEIGFQDDADSNLSHNMDQSSKEAHFCRPMCATGQPCDPGDSPAWDAMSCASPLKVFTDKGVMHAGQTSLYPPRNDLERAGPDDTSVAMFEVLNPFDAVSQATPTAGVPATFSWPIPPSLAFGDYVLFVEVSREFDMNATYNAAAFPPPTGIPYSTYGLPYRGQPSVIYKLPFSIATTPTTATTSSYVGYSTPDGADGVIHAPDATISNTPGSGAGRLQLLSNDGSTYRLRIASKPQNDTVAPGFPSGLQVAALTSRDAGIAFVAPGDDGVTGKVQKYEIRYRVGEAMTEENFADAALVTKPVVPTQAGTLQLFTLDGLLPETEYSVAIRAIDDCRNVGPLSFLTFKTKVRDVGEIDACFIATAAYGSVMAADVDMLRRFRDGTLRKTVLGELAVETYYTFSPAVSGVVGESDVLRATARDLLAPIVARVRSFHF
jgi:hypothetical protein